MVRGVIKPIFIDQWAGFTKEYGNNIRECVFYEVKKMMQCGSLENGFLEFKCDTCGETKKVGFTCKGENDNKKQKQILFKCSGCGTEELIPEDGVNYFDTFDDGDTSVPPRFTCEECCELMESVEYEGIHEITYKIGD